MILHNNMNFDVMNRFSREDFRAFSEKRADFKVPEGFYSFNYLRSALDFLFKNGPFAKKKVVFPAFICPVVIEAALRNDIEPMLIDCDVHSFNLSLRELGQLDLSSCDAVFFNHTFGCGRNLTQVRELCEKNNIKLIEDKAQAVVDLNRPGAGDFVLISYYKLRANFGGGALYSRKMRFDEEYAKLPVAKGLWSDLGQFILKTEGEHSRLIDLWRRKKMPEAEAAAEMTWTIAKCLPQVASFFWLKQEKMKQEIEGRRKLRQFYEEYAERDFFEVQNLDDNSGHFNFALILKPQYAPLRDKLCLKLRRQGIFVDRMWYNAPVSEGRYQDYLRGEVKNARLLARSIINLPIRAEYAREDVKNLLRTVASALKKLL